MPGLALFDKQKADCFRFEKGNYRSLIGRLQKENISGTKRPLHITLSVHIYECMSDMSDVHQVIAYVTV